MRMTVFVYEKIGFPLHQVSDHMLSINEYKKKEVWTGDTTQGHEGANGLDLTIMTGNSF